MKQQLPTIQEVLEYNKEFIGELEEARKKAIDEFNRVKIIRLPLLLLMLIGLVCIIAFGSDVAIAFYIVFIIFSIPLSIAFFPVLMGKHYNQEELEFQIVSSVLNVLSNDLEYLITTHIPWPVIEESELFFMRYDQKIKGQKYIRGYYNDIYMQTSYIYLGDTEKSYLAFFPERKKSFNYMIVDFNKNFESKTIVKRDKLEKTLGFLAHNVQNVIGEGKLAKFENADFEKIFTVYTNDQVEARYLLSTSMMDKLVELNSKYKNGIEAAFLDGKIHLLIGKRTPFFNFSFSFTKDIESLFKEVYKEVEELFSLTTELELNQKLWSKQK